jgi:hypothetical protein
MLVGSNQIAMSKALGAAFLSHQVEQLERTAARGGRGDAAPNWRERDRESSERRAIPVWRGASAAATQPASGGSPPRNGRKKGNDGRQALGNGGGEVRQKRRQDGARRDKDADVIIVDASVLIHCISQFKAWCREGREEIVIVPLEGMIYTSNKLSAFSQPHPCSAQHT